MVGRKSRSQVESDEARIAALTSREERVGKESMVGGGAGGAKWGDKESGTREDLSL